MDSNFSLQGKYSTASGKQKGFTNITKTQTFPWAEGLLCRFCGFFFFPLRRIPLPAYVSIEEGKREKRLNCALCLAYLFTLVQVKTKELPGI